MTPGSGILTQLLDLFLRALVPGYEGLLPDVKSLLSILATLEIALVGLWMAFDGGHRIEITFLRKSLQIGFFVWVVSNYHWLNDIVIQGFIAVGIKAGGGSTSRSLVSDPSQIIDYGFAVTAPIFNHTDSYGLRLITTGVGHIFDMLFTEFCAILIVIAFFGIALLVFITTLEFYIISILGFMLIPFGVFSYTKFLAEKVFGSIIAFGIRLMVLSFVLSVTQNTLATLTIPPEPTVKQMTLVLFTALTIMVLSWHAPAIASGFMAGSPGLGVGAPLGTGLAVAGGVISTGAMAASAIQLGTKATMAAARAVGVVGRNTVIAAVSLGRGGGAAGGGAAGGGAAGGGAGSGEVRGNEFKGVGGGGEISTSPGNSSVPAGGGAPAWAKKLAPPKDLGRRWAQNTLVARGIVPHDTHAGGGISVSLHQPE